MSRRFEGAEGRAPIELWARAPSVEAVRQLVQLASQPWITAHVAGMPDLHVAHGVAVGSVFATERAVVPAALGTDLGCGMRAVRLDHEAAALDRRRLERVLEGLTAAIPVGDAVHRRPRDVGPPPALSTAALEHDWARLSPRHLGTLGGGNHFVELDADATGGLWLLVHTGSRGIGGAIGTHHARVAAKGGWGTPPALRTDEAEGAAFLADLAHACAFAAENRAAIVQASLSVLAQEAGVQGVLERFDVPHNFAAVEAHGGRPLVVHRKGAIPADEGRRGLVPGSMGTATWVVEGLGEARSFRSASHGAGRLLSRGEARRRLRPEKLRAQLRGVVFDERRLAALIEEAPDAYRPIAEVLEDEPDLVRPVTRLTPRLVLKG